MVGACDSECKKPVGVVLCTVLRCGIHTLFYAAQYLLRTCMHLCRKVLRFISVKL